MLSESQKDTVATSFPFSIALYGNQSQVVVSRVVVHDLSG